jgi:hypothetical protein
VDRIHFQEEVMILLRAAVCGLVVTAAAAGAAQAQDRLAAIKLDPGHLGDKAGILRCDVNPTQNYGLALEGEDASMTYVSVADYEPEVRSTNEAVVRAARSSDNEIGVNIRCVGDGEAWVVATAGGVQTVLPVLVGKARRQAGMTTTPPPAPVATGVGAQVSSSVRAPVPTKAEVNGAVDAAKAVMGIFGRRP